MKHVVFLLLFIFSLSTRAQQHIIVLGIAQDGGFPHIGCQNYCRLAHNDPSIAKFVVSLALVDEASKKWWLFEATPDMPRQLQYFQELTDNQYEYLPDGIFITHAHMGHYTGLMHLGREALGAKAIKVFTLPKMGEFLASNGPWSQLVSLENIAIHPLDTVNSISLSSDIKISTFQVPHRDEFSETAGFHIATETSSYLFIPDIDKWANWERDIVKQVQKVDHAFLDATFYQDGELPNRSMHEVPHPFVEETMALFQHESAKTKNKVVFIHLNHTNPLLFDNSAKAAVESSGFRLAIQGSRYR